MIRFSGFADLVEHMVSTRPDAVACTFWEDGVRNLTWRDLANRIDGRAEELHQGGRSCEAVLADGSPECVVEIFAACKAGLQVALLNPFLPIKVAAPLLHAVDADAVWARDALRQIELSRELAPERAVAGGPGALLFFTSGTTSAAKAVELSESSLMASAYNGSSLLPLSEQDTLLCMLPLSHVFGFVCGLLWGLSCGATVALGGGPRTYATDFETFRPTAVALVPKLLEFALAKEALNDELALVLVGAADCPDNLLERVRARGIRTSLGYGLTETSSGVALSLDGDPHAMTVCPDDRICIAEDDEILIEAPTCMMRGYYRDAERTAEVLCDGVLHTGDLGRIDDAGRLHVTGRKKDMFVLDNGTKVFVPDYEAALRDALREHDVALVQANDAIVLACGKLSKPMTSHDVLTAIADAMSEQPRGSRVTQVAMLGHALPRTAAGDVEKWKIREELQQWQPSKK